MKGWRTLHLVRLAVSKLPFWHFISGPRDQVIFKNLSHAETIRMKGKDDQEKTASTLTVNVEKVLHELLIIRQALLQQSLIMVYYVPTLCTIDLMSQINCEQCGNATHSI